MMTDTHKTFDVRTKKKRKKKKKKKRKKNCDER